MGKIFFLNEKYRAKLRFLEGWEMQTKNTFHVERGGGREGTLIYHMVQRDLRSDADDVVLMFISNQSKSNNFIYPWYSHQLHCIY